MTFERIVHMEPAYDKRAPEPAKNYGIHGVNLRMILKGPLGATQFLLFTNWQLPHVTEESLAREIHRGERIGLKCSFLPMPADLGYHWLTPRYEGQETMGPCEYCDGKPCFYDGSGLNAEGVFEILLREGSDGVWKKLEAYYHQLAAEAPSLT